MFCSKLSGGFSCVSPLSFASASAIADSTPPLSGSSAFGSACAGSHLYMKTIDGFSLESDLASLNQWCRWTGGGGSMCITVPSRPTNFPFSLSFSLSSSSSAFLRRKKLLNDIQRLGFASGRRPSECRMDSASVDLVGLLGLAQLLKCLCSKLLAW